MCGRYTLRKDPERLREHFDLRGAPVWNARFNLAPAQEVPMVVAGPEGPRWSLAEWGLRPAWLPRRGQERATEANPGGFSGSAGRGRTDRGWINARAETVASRPAFRTAFRQRRCLLPADGFYEWRLEKGIRKPGFFQRRDGEVFAFAGLWEPIEESAGRGAGGSGCAIITTSANSVVAGYHDRMPVMLRREDYADWLGAGVDRAAVLLRPFPADEMEVRPAAARWVNSARYDGPNCLSQLEA